MLNEEAQRNVQQGVPRQWDAGLTLDPQYPGTQIIDGWNHGSFRRRLHSLDAYRLGE